MAPRPRKDTSHRTTPSREQYVETIADLLTNQKVCSVTDIAEGANVSKAAASRAVRDLADQDLVEHKAYGYVDLTEKGHALAGELSARHEAIYAFLHGVLGCEAKAADDEACRLEHLLEPELVERLERLAAFLAAEHDVATRWQSFRDDGR